MTTIMNPQARPFFRLEGARTLRLLDVLANAGWLQTAPPPTPESPPGGAQCSCCNSSREEKCPPLQWLERCAAADPSLRADAERL
jgi:hypothetical protein